MLHANYRWFTLILGVIAVIFGEAKNIKVHFFTPFAWLQRHLYSMGVAKAVSVFKPSSQALVFGFCEKVGSD